MAAASESTSESRVRVAVRVRPLTAREQGSELCLRVESTSTIVAGNANVYMFDHVFGPATSQAEVYTACVANLVRGTLAGLNATVFAYGQTGSGKTFTMGAPEGELATRAEDVGMTYRAIRELFALAAHCSADDGSQFSFAVSYLELYLEEVVDLLRPGPRDRDAAPVIIREDERGGTVVSNLTTTPVANVAEVMRLVVAKGATRRTAGTKMNEHSSRSHSILTLTVERQQQPSASPSCPGPFTTARMHFVDLAGSERAKATGNQGQRFKESVHINSGLLALGNVINALVAERPGRRQVHVPYRDSKLTRLLKDALGGNSQTLMLACVSPSAFNYEETVNSLMYASRARNIRNVPVVNTDPQAALIARMVQEIEDLKVQLREPSLLGDTRLSLAGTSGSVMRPRAVDDGRAGRELSIAVADILLPKCEAQLSAHERLHVQRLLQAWAPSQAQAVGTVRRSTATLVHTELAAARGDRATMQAAPNAGGKESTAFALHETGPRVSVSRRDEFASVQRLLSAEVVPALRPRSMMAQSGADLSVVLAAAENTWTAAQSVESRSVDHETTMVRNARSRGRVLASRLEAEDVVQTLHSDDDGGVTAHCSDPLAPLPVVADEPPLQSNDAESMVSLNLQVEASRQRQRRIQADLEAHTIAVDLRERLIHHLTSSDAHLCAALQSYEQQVQVLTAQVAKINSELLVTKPSQHGDATVLPENNSEAEARLARLHAKQRDCDKLAQLQRANQAAVAEHWHALAAMATARERWQLALAAEQRTTVKLKRQAADMDKSAARVEPVGMAALGERLWNEDGLATAVAYRGAMARLATLAAEQRALTARQARLTVVRVSLQDAALRRSVAPPEVGTEELAILEDDRAMSDVDEQMRVMESVQQYQDTIATEQRKIVASGAEQQRALKARLAELSTAECTRALEGYFQHVVQQRIHTVALEQAELEAQDAARARALLELRLQQAARGHEQALLTLECEYEAKLAFVMAQLHQAATTTTTIVAPPCDQVQMLTKELFFYKQRSRALKKQLGVLQGGAVGNASTAAVEASNVDFPEQPRRLKPAPGHVRRGLFLRAGFGNTVVTAVQMWQVRHDGDVSASSDQRAVASRPAGGADECDLPDDPDSVSEVAASREHRVQRTVGAPVTAERRHRGAQTAPHADDAGSASGLVFG